MRRGTAFAGRPLLLCAKSSGSQARAYALARSAHLPGYGRGRGVIGREAGAVVLDELVLNLDAVPVSPNLAQHSCGDAHVLGQRSAHARRSAPSWWGAPAAR